MMAFSSLELLAAFAKQRALRGIFDGRQTDRNLRLIEHCTHHYIAPLRNRAANILFTRDSGHHTGGWWKNPDYELCWHLSVSMRDPDTWTAAPREQAFFQKAAETFFGDDVRLTWMEVPTSALGRQFDVWHYRLFCNAAWEPILPRGEVYSKQFTELGWKSFSEIHGAREEAEQA